MIIRYAIRFISPEGTISYQMQGLPKVKDGSDGFEFAILYSSIDSARLATRGHKLRTRIAALKICGWKFEIVEVHCSFGSIIEI